MNPGRYPRGFNNLICRAEVQNLLQYLLLHPGCTRMQIMQDTQLTYSEISQLLPRLKSNGIITAELKKKRHTYSIYSISRIYLPALSQDLGGLGGAV